MKKITLLAGAFALLPMTAFAGHHEGEEAAKGAASPQALTEAFCAGVIAEDADALTALYTPDADSYGPGGDVIKGHDAIRAGWAGFFDAFDDLTCETEEAGLVASGDTASAWGLWMMSGAPAGAGPDAERVDMKGRYMDVMVKTEAGWFYRADHASMLAEATDAEE